ncbi:hypothetical protein [Cloacibacillus porcorum]|uniref:Uncharacterized protein n=1 Tax=Cloacibacillus porcorum TaxID=1197717 RepID=A0A1B2I3S7_9BACT|nr:hypothetical protein [Cloacibacillus porcorum]ANZ44624.1 hypothetical protein BED41_05685 [Cloacibacillus porcorum]
MTEQNSQENDKKPMFTINEEGYLIFDEEVMKEMMRELQQPIKKEITERYSKVIFKTIAVVLLPIIMAAVISGWAAVAYYNNSVNTSISEKHYQMQEQIHQLEKQIIVLQQTK